MIPIYCKIVTSGDSNVGKTSLLKRYIKKSYNESTPGTIGVDFMLYNKKCKIKNKDYDIKIQIWDTSGYTNFEPIIDVYLRYATIIVLLFDLSEIKTFKNIKYKIKNIHEKCYTNIPIVLIGHKSDKESKVSESEINDIANLYNMKYIAVSSRNNTNVEKAFDIINDEIINIIKNTNISMYKIKNISFQKKIKKKFLDKDRYCCFNCLEY